MTRICALVAPLSLAGCGLVFGGGEPEDPVDSVAHDLAEFDALASDLESARTLELDEQVDAIQTGGDWLAWLEGGTTAQFGARKLPGGIDRSGPVPIGDEQTAWNFRMSSSHAMTAHRAGGQVLYQAWSLDEGALVDELELPEPVGANWSPYALIEDRAWVIEDQVGAHSVLHWQLGVEPATPAGTLEQAGVDVDTLFDFGVAGAIGSERLVVLADARLWLVEVGSWTATWIETDTEVGDSLAWSDRDLLFTTADGGLHVYSFIDGSRRRIDEELAASDWQLNATYTNIHLPTGEGATLVGARVVYLGSAGLFAYGLDDGAIEPVLLEPRWDPEGEAPRIEYVDLWPLGDARVIVTGLESESGSVGADGPVYSVEVDR
ncbi:hypothetical protein ACNOYE_20260 [Nannocystaceae bacterium ST9]